MLRELESREIALSLQQSQSTSVFRQNHQNIYVSDTQFQRSDPTTALTAAQQERMARNRAAALARRRERERRACDVREGAEYTQSQEADNDSLCSQGAFSQDTQSTQPGLSQFSPFSTYPSPLTQEQLERVARNRAAALARRRERESPPSALPCPYAGM